MDSFNRRIDPEDSFDVGEDLLSSFDMASSCSSFTIPSPGDSQTTESSTIDDTGSSTDDRQPGKHNTEEQADATRHHRRPLYEAPDFIRRLNVFEEVDVGGSVTFECQVRAFPRPTIRWYKDDAEVACGSSNVADETVRIRSEDLTGLDSSSEGLLRLLICDARKEDEGAYRCKAENEEGVAATTGYLSVTGPSTGQSPQHSPRLNAISTPPLLRAITEQQSMEDKEAALYVVQQDDDEDSVLTFDDDELVQTGPGLSSIGDYSMYAEYLKEAIDADDGLRLEIRGGTTPQETENGTRNTTSSELDDFADKLKSIVEPEVNSTAIAPAACSPSSTDDVKSTLSSEMAMTNSSAATTESANDDAEGDALSASMVNVVVVEYEYPEESTVVIGSADPSTVAADTEAASPTGHDGTSPEMESTSVGFVQSSTEHSDVVAVDKAIDKVQSMTSSPAATSDGENDRQSWTIDGNAQQNNGDLGSTGGAASTSETTRTQLTTEQSDAKLANVGSRSVPERKSGEEETLEKNVDDSGVRKDTSSSGRSLFSFASIFQESLKTKPASITTVESDNTDLPVQSQAPCAVEETKSQSADTSSPRDETNTNLEVTESSRSFSQSNDVTNTNIVVAENTSSLGEVDEPIARTVELTWSTFFEWYLGWFEMPWFVYWLVAVLFTFASALGVIDPVWVVLTVLGTSMILFHVFPLPVKQATVEYLSEEKRLYDT